MALSAPTTPRTVEPVPAAGTPRRPRRPMLSPWSKWSTPARLRALTAAVIVATAAFAAIATMASAQIRSGFDATGHDQAPQVVAASDLSYSLYDMDANLANILMVGDQTLGPGISRDAFTALYQKDRSAADHDLELAASRAGTAGPAAEQVQKALDALGAYEALAGQVMLLDNSHPGRQPGHTPADETVLYDKATDLMQQALLPSAKSVTDTSAAALETAYQDRHSQAQTAMLWIGLAGLVVVATLGVFQFTLFRRTLRLLYPLMATATVLTAALTVWALTSLSTGVEDLRSAKKDAFDSVYALSVAKALSTDANADESRFIVDPARAPQYRDAFLAKSQMLLDLGPGVTLQTYDAGLKTALGAYFADPANHPVGFAGYFGTELKNITFPGERDAAEQVLETYQAYELDDRALRQKAETDLTEAIRFDTSPAAADSDGAFNAYTAALQNVTDINQKAFDQRVGAGLSALNGWPWIPLGGASAVIVLTIVGIRPRLNEYR